MNNCQYMPKKAMIFGFLGVFAVFSFVGGAYAQVTIKPSGKPSVSIKPPVSAPATAPVTGIDSLEIKEVVDRAMKIIDTELEKAKEAKKKEVAAKFPPNSPQLTVAMNGVDAAFAAIREGARIRVEGICTGLKCDTEKIQEIAEAYVTKQIALDFLAQYTSFVNQSIPDTEKQLADMRKTMEKFNTKIDEGRNGWGYWLFGDVFGDLKQAEAAREQARQITMRIRIAYERLNEMRELFNKLQAGINGATLSEAEALKLIGKIKNALTDIERATAEILPYLSKPELMAVVAKHAPEIDLKARATMIEQASSQIKAKLKEFETEKAKEMQKQLLKVLPVPVDLTKPLPQIVMPKTEPVEGPKPNPVRIKPFIEPSSEPATVPSPSITPTKPSTAPATTYRLSWPFRDGAGRTIRYDIIEYPSSEKSPTPYNGTLIKSEFVPVPSPAYAPRKPLEALPTYR